MGMVTQRAVVDQLRSRTPLLPPRRVRSVHRHLLAVTLSTARWTTPAEPLGRAGCRTCKSRGRLRPQAMGRQDILTPASRRDRNVPAARPPDHTNFLRSGSTQQTAVPAARFGQLTRTWPGLCHNAVQPRSARLVVQVAEPVPDRTVWSALPGCGAACSARSQQQHAREGALALPSSAQPPRRPGASVGAASHSCATADAAEAAGSVVFR